MQKAPIFHENIFKTPGYFPVSPKQQGHAFTTLVGCGADLRNLEGVTAKLPAVLYRNPFEQSQPSLSLHVHGLTLTTPLEDLNLVVPAAVSGIDHVLCNSEVQDIVDLRLYVIDDLVELK